MPHPNGGLGNRFQTDCSFEQAYSFIKKYEPYSFESTTKNEVTAQTGKTKSGDRAIMFPGHGNACSACWGYRNNCSNTRVGHCVEALAKKISLTK